MLRYQLKVFSVLILMVISASLVSCGESSNDSNVDQNYQTSGTFVPQDSIDCSESETIASSESLEESFWQRWCASSISERLQELGVVLSPEETWKSFSVTVGVNICNDIGSLIAGGISPYDAQLEIENKFSSALLGGSIDMDQMILAKGVALSATLAAVEILCPENAEVEEVLQSGTGEGCSVDALTYNSECPGVDLAGADLSGRDLTSVNLSGANLEGTDFTGSDLTYANLSGTNAQGAIFDEVRFWSGEASDANFAGSSFGNAYLSKTSFVRTDFSGANLVGANFESSDLRGSRLHHVVGFSRASGQIHKAYFANAHLGFADLTGAILPGVSFRGAILDSAILDSADLREAYFECADLTNVFATRTNALGATYNNSTIGQLLSGMTRAVNSEKCDPKANFPIISD